jgi:alkylation response protein AidB-like acyl-CoA dehydrogenase
MAAREAIRTVAPMMLTIDTLPSDDPGTSLLDDAEALAGEAADRVDELDAGRRIPADLYLRATRAGLFRQLLPASLGGDGAAPVAWFRTGLAMARLDASLAWTVTQGAAELGWIAVGGDPAWAGAVLADPEATSASSTAGLGTLRHHGATATLSGRWSTNTGCTNASWIGGLSIVDGGAQAGSLRLAWVPAERATTIEDWDTTGLRGTGSHSTVVDEQEVPIHWTVATFDPTPNDRGAHRTLVGNGNWPIAGSVAAVLLGLARRCLDEVEQLAPRRTMTGAAAPLSEDADVLRRLAVMEGSWHSAVAAVSDGLEAMWADATATGELSTERRWRLAATHAAAADAAAAVVEGCVDLAGTSAAPRTSALARRAADARILRTHLAVGPAVRERIGRCALGLSEPDMMV